MTHVSIRVGDVALCEHGLRIGCISLERPCCHLDALFSRKSRDKVITEGCHPWNFPCQRSTCQAVVLSSGVKPGLDPGSVIYQHCDLGPRGLSLVFLTCSMGLIQELTSWGAVHLK